MLSPHEGAGGMPSAYSESLLAGHAPAPVPGGVAVKVAPSPVRQLLGMGAPLWMAVSVVLALTLGVGLTVGGANMLGDGWAQTNANVQVGLTKAQVVGVWFVLCGIVVVLLSMGSCMSFLALSSRRWGALLTGVAYLIIAVVLLVSAYAGGYRMLQLDQFWASGYDQLRFLLGLLILLPLTFLASGAVCLAAKFLLAPMCTKRAREHKLPASAQPYAPLRALRNIFMLVLTLITFMVLSASFQALWQSSTIVAYWMAPIADPSYIANSVTDVWTFKVPAVAVGLWDGTVHAKLYKDAAVYYAYLFALIVLSVLTRFLLPVRRLMHHRVRVRPACVPRWLCLWPDGAAIGELLLLASFIALYAWWFRWWSVDFNNTAAQDAGDPNISYNTYARTLGHMANLTMSFILFPVTRNSVWESVFGIPFERAVKYHRALGRLTWVLVTCHMLTWYAKWAREHTLGANVVANTGLLISPTNAHADNFTIIIAETGWLVLTFMLVVAAFCRRRNYALFKYTHYAAWVFLLAALVHSWTLWYYLSGGLVLYAFDKLQRLVKGSSRARVLHCSALDGITTLQVDANALRVAPHAGQYVFLCIPVLSATQWHPFTIASAPTATSLEGEPMLEFHIRASKPGTWTHRLSQLTDGGSDLSDMDVYVEGPYGNAGDYESSTNLVLVAGGIGVTPMHSILADMVARWQHSMSTSVRNVTFVWVVRDAALLRLAQDTFSAALKAAAADGSTGGVKFNLELHVTHGHASTIILGAGVSVPVHAGRPDLPAIMAKVALAPGDTTALVCGPTSMIEEVSSLAIRHGMRLHSEVFEL